MNEKVFSFSSRGLYNEYADALSLKSKSISIVTEPSEFSSNVEYNLLSNKVNLFNDTLKFIAISRESMDRVLGTLPFTKTSDEGEIDKKIETVIQGVNLNAPRFKRDTSNETVEFFEEFPIPDLFSHRDSTNSTLPRQGRVAPLVPFLAVGVLAAIPGVIYGIYNHMQILKINKRIDSVSKFSVSIILVFFNNSILKKNFFVQY